MNLNFKRENILPEYNSILDIICLY